MANNFWDKVCERAYFKYNDRRQANAYDDPFEDWDEAFREQSIEEKVAEEAYYHYLNGCSNDIFNWEDAKREIYERLSFIAYYQHESNMNKPPIENWVNAQKIYIYNF